MKRLHPELGERIERCFVQVYRKLGYGFLEKIYEKALCLELQEEKISYSLKPKLDVFYDGATIGHFFPDLLVEESIIVEIKSIEGLKSVHEVQLVNYLAASQVELGYLVNFGPRLEVVRKVLTNDRKIFRNDQIRSDKQPGETRQK